MMRKLMVTALLTVLLPLVMTISVDAARNTRADVADANHLAQINQFDLTGPYEFVGKEGPVPQAATRSNVGVIRRKPIGTALSPDAGIGVGVSIDLTFDGMQYGFPVGRHVSHYWNGETGASIQAGVHFTYESVTDTVPGDPMASPLFTGYNVYNAAVASDNWPRSQDLGCDLQAADSIGYGKWSNLAVLGNTYAVMTALSSFFDPLAADRDGENLIYFQGAQFNCTYDPRSGLNTSLIDSTLYRANFANQVEGNYSVLPEVVTQWNGASTVVHVLLGEVEPIDDLSGDYYVSGNSYRVFTHYYKLGDDAYTGTWSAGSVIDTVMEVYGTNAMTMAASPVSGKICVSYSNPGQWGNLLNNQYDTDVFYRESLDYGLTWQSKVNVTTYQNAIDGNPNHFKAWVESPALYDSNDDLHIIWTGTKTSADPYFDGYNWNDFDTDIYHWARSSDEIVKVATGTYLNDDMLTGSINTIHCGFGGQYSGYIAFIWISECDGKLYTVWNQMQEWVNHGDWHISPDLMTDCTIEGERIAAANWEIMMSVANINSSSLWDPARHVSGTHTPDCGLPDNPDATGPCGNEYVPSVEAYALDETGMSLTWPAESIVDVTPDGDPAYNGNFYLNMEYMDDQIPGGFVQDTRGANDAGTFNSEKWVRLACVEAVEASIIKTSPSSIKWPEWVELGQSNNLEVTVINEGNVTLNVSEIGFDDAGGGWLSVTASPSPGSPFQVTAGVVHTATFDIVVDASALTQTDWLDGIVWLKSDAANYDSIGIQIHVLAATEVEPVVWDTVLTHANMFDTYFLTAGECVALAIGNTGDLGWGAGSSGLVNFDYVESETECGTTSRAGYYLIGASTFTIIADDASGTNSELSQSYNDANQADATGFDPIGDKGSIGGGLALSGLYDSTYTGRFVNRDTTLAFERTLYGPRPQTETPDDEIINFMVLHTKIYSGDGQAHNHVTLGNVVDWDVPSENVPDNVSGVSDDGKFLYMRGTDTTAILSCQPNSARWATEAFSEGYTSAEWEIDNCVGDDNGYYSINSLDQLLMTDTTHYRDGTDLVPDQPNPLVWWDETMVPGMNGDATVQDQAIWLTYKHDYNLAADDTLHFWTILSTVRNGTLADLQDQVSYAKGWYKTTIRGCAGTCCDGRVGDANGSNVDEPTIGDISVMIDAKFITGNCVGPDPENPILPCLDEADINQSASGPEVLCSDVTIGDISYLIDYLFITGPLLGLNDCL